MIHITSEPYAFTATGEKVVRYTLTNSQGTAVSVLDYGCIIQKVVVKGNDGVERDVVLGYDKLEDYENSPCYFGALVGRYANRIKNAEFVLNGKKYFLPKNFIDKHHIHGSFSFRVFEGFVEENSVCFRRLCPQDEEGYPGNLDVEVRYRLTDDNELEITYRAVCDEDTVVNLTNHSYFNLNGNDGSDILSHTLCLDSDQVTEIDSETIMTGKYRLVENTPFDFRTPKIIGRDIEADDDMIQYADGFDVNYVLNGTPGELRKVAWVQSKDSPISLEVYTTESAVQFYTGNFLAANGVVTGKNGIVYPKYGGVCLETQHSPCSPNYPEFPSTELKQGEEYVQKTIYKFLPSHT